MNKEEFQVGDLVRFKHIHATNNIVGLVVVVKYAGYCSSQLAEVYWLKTGKSELVFAVRLIKLPWREENE